MTDPWLSKQLGDGMWADIPSRGINHIFQPSFEAAGKPIEMAVFTRREEGRLRCEVTAYFSPAAKDVAEWFGALPCAPPARAGLELLAGDESCWLALFPESGG